MAADRLDRALLAAALLAGATYLAAGPLQLPEAADTVWKGAGVALLAAWAARRARDADGWLLTAVMALGAAGDVLLETHGLTIGALAFLAGHLVAIGLYRRNRRPAPRPERLAAWALVPAVVAVAFLLPADRAGAPGVALYTTGLAAMAAMAWLSRFPRSWVGLGAILFVASDLLIFARAGPLSGTPWVSPAIWILYFAGQAMICLGVARTLEARAA